MIWKALRERACTIMARAGFALVRSRHDWWSFGDWLLDFRRDGLELRFVNDRGLVAVEMRKGADLALLNRLQTLMTGAKPSDFIDRLEGFA